MLTRSLAGLSSFVIYLLFWFSHFLDVEHENDPYHSTALGEVANERIKDGTFLSRADAATLTCLRYETRAETVVRTQWPIVFGVNESVTMLPLYLCTNLCSSRSSPCCFSLVRLDAPYNYSHSRSLSLSIFARSPCVHAVTTSPLPHTIHSCCCCWLLATFIKRTSNGFRCSMQTSRSHSVDSVLCTRTHGVRCWVKPRN